MNKIEKERKFLLKKLPVFEKYDKIENISQHYADGWRFRSTFNIAGKEIKYEKLRKQKQSDGVNIELEVEEIDVAHFTYGMEHSDRSITKDRYTVYYKGNKFEMDYFYNMSLVICEVEDVDIDQDIEWPPEIEKQMLMEVTGNPKFDNFNLALIKHKK